MKVNKTIAYAALVVLTCLCFLGSGYCQNLPQVVLPSPQASALFRYQEYPVNHSTGVVDVSVPIYEVKSGQLSVPISISYHSSGRRVSDETGAIGLGWVIRAGGMISRTIYGDADDNDNQIKFPSPWKRQLELSNQTDFDYLAGIDNYSPVDPLQWYDTEYDIFSYSVNSLGGKFVLKDVNNSKVPVLIPKKPFKVDFHKVTAQYNINYFDYLTLVDDKGTTYRFGKSLKDGKENIEDNAGGKVSWLLSEIISPDKVDTVFFEYRAFQKKQVSITQDYFAIYGWYDSDGGQPPSPDQGDESEVINVQYNTAQRLTKIKFKEGQVIFKLAKSVVDPTKETDLVTGIEIRDLSGSIVRTIDFNKSKLDIVSDVLEHTEKLNEVVFRDRTGNSIERYSFEYHPSISNTNIHGTPFINLRHCDLWGYYNASGVDNMRPHHTIHFRDNPYFSMGNPNAIRTPNVEAMKSGVLKRITFPTGGTTEFTYEGNKIINARNQSIIGCGGLRIYQITSNDNNGKQSKKTYKYGAGESGYGYHPLNLPGPEVTSYTTTYAYYGPSNTRHNQYSKLIFSSNVLPIFSYIAQKPVTYTEVTEYHGIESDNNGKTIYRYDYEDYFGPESVPSLFVERTYNYWKTSVLRERLDYKRKGNSGNYYYAVVKASSYHYTETESEADNIYGLHIKRELVASPNSERTAAVRDGLEVYSYGDYIISVGSKVLTGTDEIDYTDNGEFVTTSSYNYNDRQLLSRTTKLVSNNNALVSEYKYPFDFPGDVTLQAMQDRNMLNYVIEQKEFKNNTHLKSIKTNYANWGSAQTPIFAPQLIEIKDGINPYGPRLRYHSYSNQGNPLSVSKENDVKVSYVWGYKHSFPIAEVTNANVDQIAYTSFESPGEFGGWSVSGSVASNLAAKTGKRYLNLSGNISKSLPAGTYLLQFFSRAALTINGGTIQDVYTSPADPNGWILIVKKLTITSPTTLTLSGNTQVDELRLYPASAQMTTYCYEPLTGMTSKTDTNCATQYFEYDSYGRLKEIKDHNRDLLKLYEYNYQSR